MVTQLKNSKCDNTKRTPIVTKLKISNCDKFLVTKLNNSKCDKAKKNSNCDKP